MVQRSDPIPRPDLISGHFIQSFTKALCTVLMMVLMMEIQEVPVPQHVLMMLMITGVFLGGGM